MAVIFFGFGNVKKAKELAETVGKNSTDYANIADKILELQLSLSGGTGGEVLISVCSELLKIKREQKKAFSYVENEVNELIKYANSIGLFPE